MVARKYLSPSEIDGMFWWEYQEMVEGIVEIIEEDKKQQEKEEKTTSLKNPSTSALKVPEIKMPRIEMPKL